jgi:phosphatidylserine/phosphatidylglycerophosphate/cardiolipin synthase-like enzyme
MYALVKGAKTNIYIGKNAGKRVRNHLKKASSSIGIISPYLSSELIADIREMQDSGVNVHLVTTSEILNAPKSGNIIRELVRQFRTVRHKSLKTRKIALLIRWPIYLAILASFYFTYKGNISIWQSGIFSVVALIILNRLLNIRVYDYYYETALKVTCLLSPGTVGYGNGVSLCHTKLYLIDGKTAFLGSLNYTWSGVKYNTESCIEVLDRESVQDLKKYFFEVFNSEQKMDLAKLGPRYFREPKN